MKRAQIDQLWIRVSEIFSINPADARVGGNRRPRTVLARQAVAWLLHERGLSLHEVAAIMGYKDHTSVMDATAKMEKQPEDLRARLQEACADQLPEVVHAHARKRAVTWPSG